MAQQYDVTTKLLLDRGESPLFDILFGGPVGHWHNIEIPKVENKRSDLIAETLTQVFYLEIDTQNDKELLPHAARNWLGMKDRFPGKEVSPVIFYIGRKPLTLPCPYESSHITFRYALADSRDLPGKPFLESADIRDNILAILTDADKEEVVETVLRKLVSIDPRRRDNLALQFTILGGLRDAEEFIMKRVRKMVTMQDLMENKVIGPMLQGKYAEGQRAGEQVGRRMLRLMLESRFGPITRETEEKINLATEAELALWAVRVLSAETAAEIFR